MADQWSDDSDIIFEEETDGVRKVKKPKILILNTLQEISSLEEFFRSQRIYQENPITLTLGWRLSH